MVISESQRARGLDTEGSFRARLRGILPLVGPVILSSLTDVEERSLALESRAFSRPGRRRLLWAMGDTTWERVLRWAIFLALVVAAIARLSGVIFRSAMLELRGVSYRYAGYARSVLHDVDLTLEDGRILGLVGANDAGKSTLCLVAAGVAPGRSAASSPREACSRSTTSNEQGSSTSELARVRGGFQNPSTQLSGILSDSVCEEVAFGPR